MSYVAEILVCCRFSSSFDHVKKYINESVGVCDLFVAGVRWRPGIPLQTAVPFSFIGFKTSVCVTLYLYILRTHSLLVHWYLLACLILKPIYKGGSRVREIYVVYWNQRVERVIALRSVWWRFSVCMLWNDWVVHAVFSSGCLNMARSLSGVWHGRVDNVKWRCVIEV
jgi:hypothetical protein